MRLKSGLTILFLICFANILVYSQSLKKDESKTDESALPFSFTIVKEIWIGIDGDYSTKVQKMYIFLEEQHFSEKNLRKLFLKLSAGQTKYPLFIKVFSDKNMLDWLIRGENQPFSIDFANTPEGRKAKEKFFEENYPPDTGYLRAYYQRTKFREFFVYSPEKDNEGYITVIIKEENTPK